MSSGRQVTCHKINGFANICSIIGVKTPTLCPQLKKAKLADTLSNQLQKRPGPLELVQKNILHLETEKAEEEEKAAKDLEQAVREGQIQFRPTIEGVPSKQGGNAVLLRNLQLIKSKSRVMSKKQKFSLFPTA